MLVALASSSLAIFFIFMARRFAKIQIELYILYMYFSPRWESLLPRDSSYGQFQWRILSTVSRKLLYPLVSKKIFVHSLSFFFIKSNILKVFEHLLIKNQPIASRNDIRLLFDVFIQYLFESKRTKTSEHLCIQFTSRPHSPGILNWRRRPNWPAAAVVAVDVYMQQDLRSCALCTRHIHSRWASPGPTMFESHRSDITYNMIWYDCYVHQPTIGMPKDLWIGAISVADTCARACSYIGHVLGTRLWSIGFVYLICYRKNFHCWNFSGFF